MGGARAGAGGRVSEPWRPPASAHVVVIDADARTWRVLDVAVRRSSNDLADFAVPPVERATGRAFIRQDAGGRKVVRVVDRHPADDWADVSKPALLAQLARAYEPPVGWVERHGGSGSSRRPGLPR